MSNFIEEFYYGNLDPQARSTKENKTVQKQMEVLMLNEEFLTENLSGENKKKFLDFVNAWGIVNGDRTQNHRRRRFPDQLLREIAESAHPSVAYQTHRCEFDRKQSPHPGMPVPYRSYIGISV